MNWQTLNLFQEAMELMDIGRGGVFTPDQTALLVQLMFKIHEGLEHEGLL